MSSIILYETVSTRRSLKQNMNKETHLYLRKYFKIYLSTYSILAMIFLQIFIMPLLGNKDIDLSFLFFNVSLKTQLLRKRKSQFVNGSL